MKLHVGERLPGAGPPSHPGGYVVTAVVSETPWYGLYTAKKIFYNFDFTNKRLRETEEKEWLDVYLRTINYPRLDDPDYVAERRALARAEARRILGNRGSNLWPEPLDLLEVPNTRDPFTFAPAGAGGGEPEEAPPDLGFSTVIGTEPILVFARPQGEPLARWQQNVQPLSWVLGVLAELLDFVRAAHGDGLLLNGLGPGAVLVDRVGQVHYLATDMVVDLAGAGPGDGPHGSSPPENPVDWALLFPPERYPRGFSAPECFDLARPRDRRTDIYGWATVAYFLLTGDRPAQLAMNQGQLWARFQDAHFAELDRALRSVPPAHVRDWAEQLGVDTDALVQNWPRSLLTVLRHCLREDPRQRPGSVQELRAWLVAPPPPPLPAVLAVRTGRTGPVKLFLAVHDIEPGLEIVVRRGDGFAPGTADEGNLVFEGPPRPWLEDAPPLSVHYAVFTRSRQGGRLAHSAAAVADILEASPAEIRRYAEATVEPGSPDDTAPARLRLLFEAFDAAPLADALYASPLPQVRGWAVARLAQGIKSPAALALLWRAVQDPTPAVALEAARGLIDGAARPPRDLVRQVVAALGGSQTDDRIQAARSLAPIGVAEDVIADTVAALERERPVACPECGRVFAGGERSGHLMRAHGYVDVFGALLPRPEAVARLWDRTFTQGDSQAHTRIFELLLGDKVLDHQQSVIDVSYPAALEAELQRRADTLLAARWQELPRLVECLRRCQGSQPFFPFLLTSSDGRVREIARELVLPELGERLAGEHISALDVRRELDGLCPPDFIEEKIQLSLRLAHVGVDIVAAEACLRVLQEERPVACPQCGGSVSLRDLQVHLRRAHRIYQFRGVRRSLRNTVATLLAAVCGSSPDYEAWRVLEEIAHEEYGNDPDGFLAAGLCRALGAVADKRRGQALAATAEAVAAANSGPRLLPVLANRAVPEARAVSHSLVLELAARLPAPLPTRLRSVVLPVLSNKQLPSATRVEAAAALLRTTGREGPAAAEVLHALIQGAGKARAIDRLRRLEKRAGTSPAIDDLCALLEDQVRMVCPRCAVKMKRPAMRSHLWEEHRLILDGRRVREPWRLIEDWLEDYRLEREAGVLDRCRDLAQRLDAQAGTFRLHQLILAHGIDDPQARRDVLAEAGRRRTSLCPHCYALVAPREEPAPAELSIWRGRLSARGYRVEAADRGLVPRLEIETPGRTLYRGREPGKGLTRKGALVLLAGPPVVAALALACVLPPLGIAALLPVAGALLLAAMLAVVAFVAWRAPEEPRRRAFDYAWKFLVPQLHAGRFSEEDSAFAAGLALASAGQGDTSLRAEPLKKLRADTETAVAAGRGPVRHLAALWRLTAEDRARADIDPVPLVVAHVGRCFDGTLPLSFAAQLLQDWDAAWWTPGTRGRLRVLLCDRAFEAGLEVQDLLEIGRVAPVLGEALNAGDADALAHLRLLWSLRPGRPWDRFGKVATVFELAADPEAGRLRLAKHPDLLLAVEEPPMTFLCVRGLGFLEELFTRPPRIVEVVARRLALEQGYELVLDNQRFPFATDPEAVARRLERLFRFFFHEFKVQVPAVHHWRSPVVSRTLRAQNAVPCPECHKPVVVRVGEVGISMDVDNDVEPPERARGKSVGVT